MFLYIYLPVFLILKIAQFIVRCSSEVMMVYWNAFTCSYVQNYAHRSCSRSLSTNDCLCLLTLQSLPSILSHKRYLEPTYSEMFAISTHAQIIHLYNLYSVYVVSGANAKYLFHYNRCIRNNAEEFHSSKNWSIELHTDGSMCPFCPTALRPNPFQ